MGKEFIKYILRNTSLIRIFPKTTRIRQKYEALLEEYVNQPTDEEAEQQGKKRSIWFFIIVGFLVVIILLGLYSLFVKLNKTFKKWRN